MPSASEYSWRVSVGFCNTCGTFAAPRLIAQGRLSPTVDSTAIFGIGWSITYRTIRSIPASTNSAADKEDSKHVPQQRDPFMDVMSKARLKYSKRLM
ncbi:hypothetical protein WJX73_003644 [Symbiochloris irregularis]|uniref:Uncharacterized protein n=1 Tax=Symbiochloris irregularis TaxID=706552 RepID=A0AAW1NP81_9CHLO